MKTMFMNHQPTHQVWSLLDTTFEMAGNRQNCYSSLAEASPGVASVSAVIEILMTSPDHIPQEVGGHGIYIMIGGHYNYRIHQWTDAPVPDFTHSEAGAAASAPSIGSDVGAISVLKMMMSWASINLYKNLTFSFKVLCFFFILL